MARAEPVALEIEALAARLIRVRIAMPAGRPHMAFLEAAAVRDAAAAIGAREHDAGGLTSRRDDRMRALIVAGRDGRELLRLELDDMRRAGRLSLRFVIVGEQHFYGLGQGGQGFDRLGSARRLWNVHVNHGQGGDIAIPLLLSHLGYGLFFDASGPATIDAGDSNDRTLVRYETDDPSVDLYLIGGTGLRATLGDVADLLGRAPMPPRWALGYLQSTRHFESADEVVALARELRARDLPCDAIILLSTYRDALGWNRGVGHLEPAVGFDAGSIFATLRQSGLRVVTHEYPVLHRDSPLAAAARAQDFLLDAGFPDVTPPSRPSTSYDEGQRYLDFARQEVGRWWWDAHRELRALGVEGWWLDGGEGPPSGTRSAGHDGAAAHNDYDLHRQRAFHDGEARDRPHLRPWLLCRSGGPGMQRFGAACWSGDVNNSFATLEAQIAIGLNLAMSGVPYWGTDIGGYYPVAPRDPELFARWFQFGAFCGVFRAHGRNWRAHLPFGHGDAVDAACRRALELRYRLMPYTYTLARQAHELGLPPMRPLVLNYPDDPNVWEMGQQFLWGDDLLVAPVTRAGARHWPVYLPAGAWFDLRTQERYAGPGGVSVAAPIDRMPLFVREGAILPLATVAPHLGGPPPERIMLQVYPGGRSVFVLYDDDGETTAYRDGVFARTTINCNASEDEIVVEIAAPAGHGDVFASGRRYALRVRVSSAPQAVKIVTAAADETRPWRLEDGVFVAIDDLAAPARVTLRLRSQ